MKPDDPRHGTYAGAQAHTKDSEPVCRPCREAATAYIRDWRKANGDAVARTYEDQKNRQKALRILAQRHPAELRGIIRGLRWGQTEQAA